MSVNGPTVHHAFSERYYKSQAQFNTDWLGTPVVKCPLDLWLYQEIIHRTEPDIIIETGTFAGGSALFLAHVCELRDYGRVISIDIEHREVPDHPRIEHIAGLSSTAPRVVEAVEQQIGFADRVMVILDSDHTAQHVHQELKLYAPLVTKGCYLVVEDTNLHAYPGAHKSYGPAQAIKDWQPTNHGFEVDRQVEKFGFSQNPSGYLRRVR